jgi:cytochrome bd-type quinol oxidase subunit 2
MKNMKKANGNGQEKPRRLTNWEKTRLVFGLGGGKRSAGGMVTVVIAVLLLGTMFAGNAAALTPQEKLDKTIGNIQTFLIGIGIALAGVMVILAGTKWVTTRGHPEEQARVKHWLMDIGIGCILILSSTVMIEVAKGLIVH